MEPGRHDEGLGCVLRRTIILPLMLSVACSGCSATVPRSAFDGERAYDDLKAIVALGPRPSGSTALERTRNLIRSRLATAGITLREYPFTAHTFKGEVKMNNLVAEIPGTEPGIIVIGNHYDTKYFPDFEFVGANDAGSTTAWMIELARTIGPRRDGHTLWLCWFDGEEALGEWSNTDGIYGSRDFVLQLHKSGRLAEIRAMINVDMIGDCALGVQRDSGAPGWLVNLVWDAARRAGHGGAFTGRSVSITDDHTPFRDAGVPSIDLIDFHYGGGAVEHQMNWHTPRDTMDLVCAESLQIMGDVILAVLPALDAELAPGTQRE